MSAWGSGPASPVSGTVITKAFWDANAQAMMNILRALTGGDPPAANYLLTSVDASTASWQVLSTGLIPDGIVTDAKLATPKVSRAGDTMTNHLTFNGDLIGVSFASGGRLRDQASPERTLLNAAGNRFSVFDEGGSVNLLDVDNAASAPTFKSTPLSLNTHTHSYLPITSPSFNQNLTALDDSRGLVLSSGGNLRDTASPERTLLSVAGDRFDVFNEASSVQLMQVDSSTMTYKAQTVIHSGNIGSQTVAVANAIADGSVSTAKIVDANVTAAKLAAGAALSNLGFTPSKFASGTYVGNGGTSARQITSGFIAKAFLVYSSSEFFVGLTTTGSVRLLSSSAVNFVSTVHLHASDGFVVADGTADGNAGGAPTYTYVVWG
jgi:hypothetical protein